MSCATIRCWTLLIVCEAAEQELHVNNMDDNELLDALQLGKKATGHSQLLCNKCITTLKHTFQCSNFLVPQCITMLCLTVSPKWGEL